MQQCQKFSKKIFFEEWDSIYRLLMFNHWLKQNKQYESIELKTQLQSTPLHLHVNTGSSVQISMTKGYFVEPKNQLIAYRFCICFYLTRVGNWHRSILLSQQNRNSIAWLHELHQQNSKINESDLFEGLKCISTKRELFLKDSKIVNQGAFSSEDINDLVNLMFQNYCMLDNFQLGSLSFN